LPDGVFTGLPENSGFWLTAVKIRPTGVNHVLKPRERRLFLCHDGAARVVAKFATRIDDLSFSPELAEIRFGCGLSPVIAAPSEPKTMLQGLSGPDTMARRFAIEGFGPLRARSGELSRLRKKYRGATDKTGLRDGVKKLRRATRAEAANWYTQTLLRWVNTPTGFRERLVAFWADHFTARGKNLILRSATAAYVEEAIRPNISGTFADLLIATTTHPLMLHYLDQASSVGPASRVATASRRLKGLNENLAREVMELHTLGVDGPYTQQDVRQLAELFTGLAVSQKSGFVFRPKFAEPGPETILGKSYGGDPAKLEPILQALRDLATHPATARHIAQKLAVHFVADTPDPGLVQHLEGRFNDTGGNLLAVSSALLEHPSSWEEKLNNVKPPADFIASACRAVGLDTDRLDELSLRVVNRLFGGPLEMMGQPWMQPNGPDGWAEDDAAWITPQGISTRLSWALSVPQMLRRDLPNPREFVSAALGPFAPPSVHFAASAAESKADAIGLVLTAPAFQRR
jgi:uncharacterized protein (DUF1800 family)